MRLDSSYWNTAIGVCTKHNIPQIPCPVCLLGEGDEDLEIIFDDMDAMAVDFGSVDSYADLVPANLRDRYLKGELY